MDRVITEPELKKLGLDAKELYVLAPSLRLPAQIEKLLPRARWGELKPLVVKVSSGVTLAPENDPRPSVKTAIPFQPIPEGAQDA